MGIYELNKEQMKAIYSFVCTLDPEVVDVFNEFVSEFCALLKKLNADLQKIEAIRQSEYDA